MLQGVGMRTITGCECLQTLAALGVQLLPGLRVLSRALAARTLQMGVNRVLPRGMELLDDLSGPRSPGGSRTLV